MRQLGNGMGDHGGKKHRRRIDPKFAVPPALVRDLSRIQPKIFQPLRCLAVGLRIDLDRHDNAGILGREMAAMTFIDAPEYPGNDEGATTRLRTGFVRRHRLIATIA